MASKPQSAVVTTSRTNALVAAYLAQLAARPLLTKSLTSGTLSWVQEYAAGKIVGLRPKLAPGEATGLPPLDWVKKNERAFKLAAYGAFISAPLSHFLMGILQKTFAGATGTQAKVKMILASNLFVSPILNVAYLSSLAVIGGARSAAQVQSFIKLAFWKLMRLSWISSPVAMAFAQRFVSPDLWVPFFASVSCVLGTYFNVQAKRAAIVAKAKRDASDKSA